MTSQLDPLMVKIQTQLLRATFIQNMATLKEKFPDIYHHYRNYSPTDVHIAFDENGFINLIADNRFVYQGDPKVASLEQVEKFATNPTFFRYEIPANNGRNTSYQHLQVLDNIFNRCRDELGSKPTHKFDHEQNINFINIMGTGLGYHIERLFDKFTIRSAFIYEPEPDCFYATLHTIDIGKLIDKCAQRGGELSIRVGGNENGVVNAIYENIQKLGFFNLAHLYQYRHYSSEKTKNAFKKIIESAHIYQSGWGFCEDEIIGISHTLTNIFTNKASVLLQQAEFKGKNTPVFVIGNGPSLDKSLAYIKRNQNNAIIVSSGTSLKPLLNYGIKPDLHVEQERPSSIYQWVKKIGFEETLKEIPLICLNTVYPGILALFKQPYVMLKAVDAGTDFIRGHISTDYKELFLCNPTVTNASTAGVVAMGFKNLTLFGLDYGFKSEQSHHAKGSIYDDIKNYNLHADFQVPGNFSDNVFTTSTFDASRRVLEILLDNNRDVQCVNTSDGAKVAMTTPNRVSELNDYPPIENKKQLIETCLNTSFDNSYTINKDIKYDFQIVIDKFDVYMEILLGMLNGIDNKKQLTNAFARQFQFINELNTDNDRVVFKRFFSGSLNFLQTSIMSNVHKYNDEKAASEFINFCIKEMSDHFTWLLADLKEHYDKAARA